MRTCRKFTKVSEKFVQSTPFLRRHQNLAVLGATFRCGTRMKIRSTTPRYFLRSDQTNQQLILIFPSPVADCILLSFSRSVHQQLDSLLQQERRCQSHVFHVFSVLRKRTKKHRLLASRMFTAKTATHLSYLLHRRTNLLWTKLNTTRRAETKTGMP